MSRETRPRLLFMAHREELLRQSLSTFRAVLRDPNFGDLLVGGRQPDSFELPLRLHPELQLASNSEKLPPDHFAYVVIDEFHHAAAAKLRAAARPRLARSACWA